MQELTSCLEMRSAALLKHTHLQEWHDFCRELFNAWQDLSMKPLFCAGVMRGAGRQLLASILNLITYWGLGLPLSCVLGLHYGLGVQGLWWGLATTTTVQVGVPSLLC